MSYRKDRAWVEGLKAEVVAILTRHLDRIVSVRVASDEEDTKRATDMVVEVAGGTVAVRVRDWVRDFRDWTIRTRRRSGARTEMAKLKEGFANWYLYGWCKPDGRIGDYVLIDLAAVRTHGLLDIPRREQSADGWQTAFVAIPVPELRNATCLAVDACTSDCPEPKAGFQPRASVKPIPAREVVARQPVLFPPESHLWDRY
jgi:hypothetical protein